MVWDASYKPFGEVNASTGAPINLRFPGQWFSSESDLNQNWMRDYDPTLGRYIQADPLGLVDGASVYGYALQSPNRYVDPTGLYKDTGLPASEGTGIGEPREDPCECAKKILGGHTAAGLGAVVGGQPITPKPFVTKGSSQASSPISSALSKRFPQKMSKSRWAPTTKHPFARTGTLGKFAGRWVPFLGWGLLALDAGLIAKCIANCKDCGNE